MKAIFTTFLPATATKPKRIKVYDTDRNAMIVSVHDKGLDEFWDASGNVDDKMQAACVEMFCRMMEWDGMLYGGHTKDGMVWIFRDRAPKTRNQAKHIKRFRKTADTALDSWMGRSSK